MREGKHALIHRIFTTLSHQLSNKPRQLLMVRAPFHHSIRNMARRRT